MEIAFTATGKPTPQGSHTVFNRGGKPIVTHVNSSALNKWRKKIRDAALKEADKCGWPLSFDGPVEVSVTFYLAKPKRPKWPVPAAKPDLDKLIRAAVDGFSSTNKEVGILRNDSRICRILADKRYVEPGEDEGAVVVCREWIDS